MNVGYIFLKIRVKNVFLYPEKSTKNVFFGGGRLGKRETSYIALPNLLLPPPGEGGPGVSPGRMRAAPGGNVVSRKT